MNNSDVNPQKNPQNMEKVAAEYKNLDVKIKEIPQLLEDFKIVKPNASMAPFKTGICWFVWSVIFVVVAAFATVYLVCANGLCVKSCNNMVLVSLFVLGFAVFVILGLLKLLIGMQKQANAVYDKELEMFDRYRKMMLERRIKDEDGLRKLYFDSLKQ